MGNDMKDAAKWTSVTTFKFWKKKYKRTGGGEANKFFGKDGNDVVVARMYESCWIIAVPRPPAWAKSRKRANSRISQKSSTQPSRRSSRRWTRSSNKCKQLHILINCIDGKKLFLHHLL